MQGTEQKARVLSLPLPSPASSLGTHPSAALTPAQPRWHGPLHLRFAWAFPEIQRHQKFENASPVPPC